MKIQFMSDLHLEFNPFSVPDVGADVLVLAGDIGVGIKHYGWVAEMVPRYEQIVYVPGNHEYYRNDVTELNQWWQSQTGIWMYKNVRRIGDIKFVCATMWPNFWGSASSEALARVGINDFLPSRSTGQPMITDKGEPWTTKDCIKIHQEHLQFVREEAEPGCVVVTHYPPTRECVAEHWRGDALNPYFVNALEDVVADSKAALWIAGHTHADFDYIEGQTRVVSNQKGYSRHENPSFDATRVIEL